MRPFVLASAFCLASTSIGLSQELADYQSRDHAAASWSALASGDRSAALLSAMKGLPADPTDADIARFPEAYDALLRASISRSLRLDLPVMSVFEFDTTGTRLASVGLMPAPDGDQSRSGLTLWSAEDGTRIADLMPMESLSDGAWGVQAPAFSPDGQYLAQIAAVDGQAVVFDASTGAEVARLDGHAPGTVPNSGGLAFSRDGAQLLTLAASPTKAHLWDTSTWTRLASTDFGQFTLLTPISGGRDGVMHFLTTDVTAGSPPPTELWQISANGASRVATLAPEPSGHGPLWGRVATDEADTLFAIPNGNFDLLVFDRASGSEVARIPAATMGQSMGLVAPAGDGVLVLHALDALPRKLDLSGADAPLSESDKLAAVHGVFSPGGEWMGGSADFFDYMGRDLPRGADLYGAMLGTLSDAERAELAADQITTD